MGLRETWNEMDTAVKVLLGLGAGLVFLLIAIPVLVIVAAIVASFVLGMGDPGTTATEAPQASIEFEYSQTDSEVTVRHTGGDDIDASMVFVDVAGRNVEWDDSDGTIEPGDTTTVSVDRGTALAVIWDGENPTVLAEFETPS